MSEMTSAVETQQQQQQYVGGSSNSEHHCKDCGLNFESEKSLEVHLRYHQENLLNQWASKAQQEESNNNHSKTGNHNSHVNANRDSVPAESCEPSSMSPSQDPTSSQQQAQQQQQQQQQQPSQPQQQQQSQQQPGIHTLVCPPYDHFRAPMFSESGYFMQNEQSYILPPHHFSPSQEDGQSNGGRDGGYARYHPYQHQQLFTSDRATSNSTSPQSPPFHCDKCGAAYDDANQLGEHVRTNHLESPTAYPSAPQYQQLGNSPQQQNQQLHSSPPLSNQPQSGYDYNGGQTIKSEMKQEQPEEQAEILDLDSHKVQTHKYEEEMRMVHHQHQQPQQHMQMHHQQVMQQQQSQRVESLPVSPMLNWPTIQTHEYHAAHPSMAINNVPPIADQEQYMRGQHIPVEHGHQGSPIITSTQPMSGHQMPAAGHTFVQQTPKAPPLANQSWKSNEPRRPKTYNCTACNKWFTSSGHLKRHYNTTLHKNAVKNGKEPDPATLPITAHHHPTRENNAGHSTSGRGGGAPARSPSELSSRSPPNLMAGPSGEATGGLLHTPTTLCNNNSSSNSSSSSESLAAVLVQQQQQPQEQQLVHVGIYHSPEPSPLAAHHQQQMGIAPQQLGLQQQQQQQPHLPTGTSGQPVHHSTTSPTIPPPAASHMNCPSPMASSSHPVHHMNSPGSAHPAMTSPTTMGGTTMPHQPYPNALPPHVTITTSIPVVPLESTQAVTTMQLVTIGNEENERPRHRSLPGFKTILPNFTEFGFAVEENQTAINVGGLNVEEIAPLKESFESSASTYDPYSPIRYKPLNNVDLVTLQSNASDMMPEQDIEITLCYDMGRQIDIENNNHLSQVGQAKEDLDPNIGLQLKKERKGKGASKQCQITTTNANFISRDGIHKCIDCNKFFNKACYLTQHNKSFHSGDKPFKCAQCGKRFPNEELHKKHTEMHALARKHQCDMCPKIFAHKTDLKRHTCIHTGKRPFRCDNCGKGFIRQDHMKKHQDTHNKKTRQNAQRLGNSRGNAQRLNNVQRPSIQRLNFDVNCIKS
ncbi:hypothetical protein PUN28_017489 [Cardiocondyla obscurior]|uniref:C2H2-type domain-containing protein n=1 Tax=Cardiocondyla obscurior TaxID=286306 RepID=A0AAW2ELD7_9HYME